MSNWENLIDGMARVIKANGVSSITGQALQDVLRNIIRNVGYLPSFLGVARPDMSVGSPDGPLFMLTGTPGIYTNFGGIEVTKEDGVVAIVYSDGAWAKMVIGATSHSEFEETKAKINAVADIIDTEGWIFAVTDKNGKVTFGQNLLGDIINYNEV